MTDSSMPPPRRPRLAHWLGSRRRRAVAGALCLLVVGVIALGITDPFSSPGSPSGVADNAYPTGTATVTEQTLSSQTEVSATLGFAGSYTVSIPNGTSVQALTQARTSAQAAQTDVVNAKAALKGAEATSGPTNASTLMAARNTVSNDQGDLLQAQSQLAADEGLGCPASSSATVTPSLSADLADPSGGPNSVSPASDLSQLTRAHSVVPHAVTQGAGSGSGSSATGTLTPASSSAPTVMTGPVDQVTSAGATLSGSVNPDGAETTYYFEYGTSPNYGETTPVTSAGTGSDAVAVSVVLAGLAPGDVYHYRLVASNSLGVAYGQDGTLQTNAAPDVATGPATSISSTSEDLAGTIDPNGVETSYYFEYGTSASFGETSPVSDAGGAQSPFSVSAQVGGLTAGATYDYALVATSSLGTVTGAVLTFQAAVSSCVSMRAVISEDSLALAEARNSLTLDELGRGAQVSAARETLVSDEMTAASDQQAVAADEASVVNANSTFTELPQLGALLHRGQSVYQVNDESIPLFYGPVPLFRALYLGVSSGLDVGELNENLVALGFEHAGSGEAFTPSTEAAVEAWQRSLGEPANGVVDLGDIVVEPGPLEIANVNVDLGQSASNGLAVLTATSRTPVVTIDLDASEQSEVKVGDAVTITLPNNANVPGVVTSVGTVAVAPSASSSSSGPTITVIVTPTKPSTIVNYDQAPVNVAITNATVSNVLTVPIDSLLAPAGGGYAVEEVSSDHVHHLVAVNVGLFDDAAGLVQVSGSGLAVGQRVVVPKL